MQLVAITTKGQVTIPIRIRENLGLEPGDKVVFEEEIGSATVRPAMDFFSFRGALKSRKVYKKEDAYRLIGKNLSERYIKTLNKNV